MMQSLIERLRSFAEYEADLADESKWERIEWEAADLIESQAAEIAELDALRNDAVLRLDKYKSLCDQMGNALKFFEPFHEEFEDLQITALEAWRAMK